ncbi:MAG: hypothetical protein ACOCZ7_04730 [Armatimonadota bacterium]
MVKIGDWLSESWEIISEDLVTHILLALIVGLGASITGGLLSGPLMGGYLWIVFKKMKDPTYTPEIGDIGKGFENFVQLFLVAIVGGLIASLGTIACIVGVFFTSALVVLALPLVVEGNMSFWPAITESIDKTKQSLINWVLFTLIIGVAQSLWITLPIAVVMMALAYRDNYGLGGAAPAASAPAAPTAPTEPPASPTPQ